ncbi:12269_t:CDS:2 [Entrophospora sp. SA101]|nr:12269_t:CDS:2 [Entrophospora sp. SA101]
MDFVNQKIAYFEKQSNVERQGVESEISNKSSREQIQTIMEDYYNVGI